MRPQPQQEVNYYYFSQPDTINNAGSKITPIGSGYDVGLFEKDSEKFNVKGITGAVCGAGMIVRKNFLKIGGFDEDFLHILKMLIIVGVLGFWL